MKKFLMLAVILVMSFFIGMTIGAKATEKDKTILAGYKYNSTLKCYKNTKTGVWYKKTVDGKIIPSNEYVAPKYKKDLEDLKVEDRPNDSWKLITVNEISLKDKDTFDTIIEKFYKDYYRMDYEWYVEQVKEINGITDINNISKNAKFKIPIYEDTKE